MMDFLALAIKVIVKATLPLIDKVLILQAALLRLMLAIKHTIRTFVFHRTMLLLLRSDWLINLLLHHLAIQECLIPNNMFVSQPLHWFRIICHQLEEGPGHRQEFLFLASDPFHLAGVFSPSELVLVRRAENLVNFLDIIKVEMSGL